MSKRKEVKYCVTAENRFTCSREIVTPPCSYEKAIDTVRKYERTEYLPDAAYAKFRVVTYNPMEV